MANAPDAAQVPESVPKDHFDTVIAKLENRTTEAERQAQESREQVAEMRGQLKAQAPAEEPKKVWTRDELQSLVDEGKITEARRDAVLEEQLAERVTAQAVEVARATTQAEAKEVAAAASVAAYTDAYPELKDKGSEKFRRVEAKYQSLIRQGLPVGSVTEQVALELVLGDPKNLPADRTREGRETHEESGGGGGGGAEGESGNRADWWAKGLPKRQIESIRANIGPGKMYRDTDNPMFKGMIERARAKAAGT